MQPNRTLFFIITGIAVVVAVGLVVGGFFFLDSSDNLVPLGQRVPPIQVVVAPSLKPWVDQAAQAYNETASPAVVRVVAANDLVPRTQFQSSSPDSPVAVWIPEASFVAELAADQGVQFEDPQSVASTGLAWGAYNDKLAQFTDTYGDLTWENLHAKAVAPEDFLKLVIASPWDTAEGIAALMSATAATLQTQEISGNSISTANTWLTETLGNRNAQIPPRPAEAFASVQGRTIGDLGLLALASWRSANLHTKTDFTLVPAEPQVTLDYPLVILTGPQVSPEAQAAARSFRQFLLQPAQQDKLANFFFDPASPDQNGVQADAAAVERLQGWAERELQ
jgi:hypothetical protein